MESVFLVCFLVGLVTTVLSLLLGIGHVGGVHFGHIGGHALGHGGAGHSANTSDTPGISAGYLNLTTIMTFVTWFGGVGYLVSHYTALGGAVSLAVAVLSGLGGGTVVALFITRVLETGQTQVIESDYAMPGTVARVTSTIFPGYAGEVIYTLAGTRQSAAARSVTGEAIPRDTEVVILKYEHGTAFVDTWQHALGESNETLPLEAKSE
jgi:hypothetical protein